MYLDNCTVELENPGCEEVSLLKAGKIVSVETDDRYKLVKCRDRGGL